MSGFYVVFSVGLPLHLGMKLLLLVLFFNHIGIGVVPIELPTIVYYNVVIETGPSATAGTAGLPWMQVTGEWGQTDVIHISGPIQPNKTQYIEVTQPVGRLGNIELGLTDPSDDWHVTKVIGVFDGYIPEVYEFNLDYSFPPSINLTTYISRWNDWSSWTTCDCAVNPFRSRVRSCSVIIQWFEICNGSATEQDDCGCFTTTEATTTEQTTTEATTTTTEATTTTTTTEATTTEATTTTAVTTTVPPTTTQATTTTVATTTEATTTTTPTTTPSTTRKTFSGDPDDEAAMIAALTSAAARAALDALANMDFSRVDLSDPVAREETQNQVGGVCNTAFADAPQPKSAAASAAMSGVLGGMVTGIAQLLPSPDAGNQLNFRIDGVGSLAYAAANQNVTSSQFKSQGASISVPTPDTEGGAAVLNFVSLGSDPSASNPNSTEGTNMPTVKLEGLLDGAKSTNKLPGDGLKFQLESADEGVGSSEAWSCVNVTTGFSKDFEFAVKSADTTWSISVRSENISIVESVALRYGFKPYQKKYDWKLEFSTGDSEADSSGLFDVEYKLNEYNLSVLVSCEDLQIGRKDNYYSMYGLLTFRNATDLNMTSLNETCFKLSGVETTVKLDYEPGVDQSPHRRRKRSVDGGRVADETDTPKVKVGEINDEGWVAYESSHFGTFSGKLFVAPNTIDFSNVFANFSTLLAESWLVLVVVISLLVIFILIGVLARRIDKKHQTMMIPMDVVGNSCMDPYEYHVAVYTGWNAGGGTDSTVNIKLFGDKGRESDDIKLDDGQRKNFQKGSVSLFTVRTGEAFSPVTHLQIWHDCDGEDTEWFLDKVQVHDPTNNKTYLFACDGYLSPVKGDCETSKLLPESNTDLRYSEYLYNQAGQVFHRHLVASVFRKPNFSQYTQLQRVGVVSAMFMLLMVSNAMWFGTEAKSEVEFKFQLGPLSVGWHELYTGIMTILTVYPALVLAAELFRRSAKSLPQMDDPGKQKFLKMIVDEDTPGKKLPRFCIGIAWVLIIVAIIVSSFFIFLYSLEWGMDKSKEWLGAFFMSLAMTLTLMDPFMLLVVYMIYRRLKKPTIRVKSQDSLKLPKTQESMDPEKKEILRQKRERDEKLFNIANDLIIYILYMFLVVSIATYTIGEGTYQQAQNIRNLLNPPLPKDPISANTYEGVYTWIENGFLPVLYPEEYYNGEQVLLEDSVWIADSINYRVTPLRIAQHRVKPVACSVSKGSIVADISKGACIPSYSLIDADTRDFEGYWKSRVNVTGNEDTAFKFVTPSDPMIYKGALNYIGDGVYNKNLGSTRRRILQNLDDLDEKKWIDRFTRYIYIDTIVYTANSNLFTLIRTIVDCKTTGQLIYSQVVTSFKLYNFLGSDGSILLALQVIWVIILLVIAIKELKKVCRQRSLYFSHNWNIVECCHLFFALSAIGVFVAKSVLTAFVVDDVKENFGEWVSFDRLILLSDGYMYLIGFTAFCTYIKAIKYLTLNPHIAELASTMKISGKGMVTFGFMIGVVMGGFIAIGYTVFGTWNIRFKTWNDSFMSLTSLSLGLVKMQWMFEADNDLTFLNKLYIIVYYVCMIIVLMNGMISLINMSYSDVRKNPDLTQYDKELLQHLLNKVNLLWNSFVGNALEGKPRNSPGDIYKQKHLKKNKVSPAPDNALQNNVDKREEHTEDLLDRLTLMSKQFHKLDTEGHNHLSQMTCAIALALGVRIPNRGPDWLKRTMTSSINDYCGDKYTDSDSFEEPIRSWIHQILKPPVYCEENETEDRKNEHGKPR